MELKQVLEQKMQSFTQSERNRCLPVVNDIMRTANSTSDYIWNIKDHGLNHFVNQNGVLVADIGNSHKFSLHPNAVGQVAEKMSIPAGYLKKLAGTKDWGTDLASTILNEHLTNADRQRLLIREVNGEIRGILSDSYRRLNTLQLFDRFIKSSQSAGATFIGARFDGLKAVLEVMNPEIFEFALPNGKIEYLCFGAMAQNSDFGASSYQVRLFLMKPICTNGAVAKSFVNQRHLGSRIPDDVVVSENTMKKDTEFFASLTDDTMKTLFSPQYKEKYLARIYKSAEKEIDIKQELEALPKSANFTKGECDALEGLLMSSRQQDGLDMPPSMWKLTNGITALARDIRLEKPMRALELQEFAGSLLDTIKLN